MYLFIYLFTHLFIYLFIYLFTYLFTYSFAAENIYFVIFVSPNLNIIILRKKNCNYFLPK